jgi:DtxR family transcriptional regulator, Mn-dependent transcriptional regulator
LCRRTDLNSKDFAITPSLEDYLKTIFEIVSLKGVARVKDIASVRKVKPGSVSPALKKLSDAGYIVYNQGEYVTLTENGNEVAVKTVTRHKLLHKFLAEILNVKPEDAERDSCAMEHNLSNSSMDKLTLFFEFIQACPEGKKFLEIYYRCPMVSGETIDGEFICEEHNSDHKFRKLSELEPGENGVLLHIHSSSEKREQLINMGFLPGSEISVEKKISGSKKITIGLNKDFFDIELSDATYLLVK